MTHRVDVARGCDVAARWCAFAEQRLEYLTELFETGRWRRYHSELGFLENIQEAKTAVEVWRGLATREATSNDSAVDVSWLDRAGAGAPRRDTPRDQVQRLSRQPAEIPVEPPPSGVSIAGQGDRVMADEAPPAPTLNERVLNERSLENASELVLYLDEIAQRYPLLRNPL
jgi:uncharacterized repeat protein (TIGR03809 family)